MAGESSPKYAFYEKVWVNCPLSENARVNGQIGAVLGRVQTQKGDWYYTVYIYSTDTSWCFFEHELLPTGECAKKEDFYEGSSVRIAVDSEGRGSVVSDDQQ